MSLNELEVCTPLSPLGYTETRKSAVCALVEWCIPRGEEKETSGYRFTLQLLHRSLMAILHARSMLWMLWMLCTIHIYARVIYMLYTCYIQPDEMLWSCNVHIYICEHSMCVRSMYVHVCAWMDAQCCCMGYCALRCRLGCGALRALELETFVPGIAWWRFTIMPTHFRAIHLCKCVCIWCAWRVRLVRLRLCTCGNNICECSKM